MMSRADVVPLLRLMDGRTVAVCPLARSDRPARLIRSRVPQDAPASCGLRHAHPPDVRYVDDTSSVSSLLQRSAHTVSARTPIPLADCYMNV
jgi:hypothetical protein